MYDSTDPSSLTNLHMWMEDAESYTYNATFLLLGNKYDNRASSSGATYQVDDEHDLSNEFAKCKEIPLHFKISTERSDDETLRNVFQSLAEQMHIKMEANYIAAPPKADYHLSCTCTYTDTVALFAETNTHTQSSCSPCSRR